ncbi:MAG: FHIPEP family type III secretion protein [Pirellulaceae bacterium]|nr:FHIPEP family type III secretion protein [Pirellulaceae bacterium]
MGPWINKLLKYRELILPVSIIACVVVILVPLPSAVMDVMLAGNITIAIIVLLTTIYIGTPLEFNVFPTLLVATTLSRLVLNVATTRLILTRAGSESTQAAGEVVEAFGNFVSGDQLVVGIVIFVIIVLIQFVVITKGATRVSEVAARFALDGMPGRQMAIDADLNSGIIDEVEAQRRRDGITRQADFYGAMDGASKFVRGDAVAGILITLINIAGGLYVGMVSSGMSLQESLEVFTRLTIGDGLVSQVPAFLISIAAALLVTRSTQQSNLPVEFLTQIMARPQALMVAAGFLGLMMFTQLPAVPLLTLGGGCVGLALIVQKQSQRKLLQEQHAAKAQADQKNAPAERKPEDFLTVDPMRVEIGVRLLALADPRRGGDLMEKITGVRSILASELGILLPKVRLKDKLTLPENSYEIQIAGSTVARGDVHPDALLAIDVGRCSGTITGVPTREPARLRPAVWIRPDQKMQAEMYGYQIAIPSMVIATHLQEIARTHADELLTREATKQLMDQLKTVNPTVVEELIPGLMKLSEVQAVLQMLLREDIPIRQLATIAETLGNFAPRIKDPVMLCEYVRGRIARTICQRFADSQGQIHVITMDPAMEDRIAAGFDLTDRGILIRMSPPAIEITCQQIAQQLQKLTSAGHKPILIVNPRIRPAVRHITQVHLPDLRVISHAEVTQGITTVAVGMVSDPLTKT